MKPIPAIHPETESPFPWHHFPNEAPKGYHTIDNTCRLMAGDLCYHMDDGCWHSIARKDIGKSDTRYICLCRSDRNSLIARAKRSRIKWQPLERANTACEPLLLKTRTRVIMGRCLSLAPDYKRQGWFEETTYGWPTDKRVYPTAWAPLPER